MWRGKGGVSKHLEGAGSQSIHKGGATAALRSGTRSQIPKQVTARKLQGPVRVGPSPLPPALPSSHKGPRHHPLAPPAGTCSSRFPCQTAEEEAVRLQVPATPAPEPRTPASILAAVGASIFAPSPTLVITTATTRGHLASTLPFGSAT